ncbi:hypothetical protein KEM55_002400, partial [Ascosphaera atra]
APPRLPADPSRLTSLTLLVILVALLTRLQQPRDSHRVISRRTLMLTPRCHIHTCLAVPSRLPRGQCQASQAIPATEGTGMAIDLTGSANHESIASEAATANNGSESVSSANANANVKEIADVVVIVVTIVIAIATASRNPLHNGAGAPPGRCGRVRNLAQSLERQGHRFLRRRLPRVRAALESMTEMARVLMPMLMLLALRLIMRVRT